MLCLGSYSVCTGLMVAVGRISWGGVGSGMNVRYHVHQTLLPVALIGAGIIIARHWNSSRSVEKQNGISTAGHVIGGVLAGVLLVAWIYGDAMMEQWQLARLKDAGAQRLSQILVNFNPFVAHVAGNYEICAHTTNDLDKAGMLRHPPFRDRKLSNFNIAPRELGDAHSGFDYLIRRGQNAWDAGGHCFFPRSERPADGVIFAFKTTGGEWTIFGYTQPFGAPYHLGRSMGKDLQFIARDNRDPWPDDMISGWVKHIAVIDDPPAGAVISAWALDAQKWFLYKLVSRPSKSGTPGEYTQQELEQPIPE